MLGGRDAACRVFCERISFGILEWFAGGKGRGAATLKRGTPRPYNGRLGVTRRACVTISNVFVVCSVDKKEGQAQCQGVLISYIISEVVFFSKSRLGSAFFILL